MLLSPAERRLGAPVTPLLPLTCMKTAEVPLTAPELNSLVRDTALRHGLSDTEVEGHLVKCLGYLACDMD
jgi:hypothetical protein